jgi:hypothetical protein
MGSLRRVATTACAVSVLAACGVTNGDAETDRQSNTLAEAISYPHQPDAAGFARAALATTLGRSGSFSVLEAKDLDHKNPNDPMAHLVWRIHRPTADSKTHPVPAFDACYTVEFNYYGPTSGPSRATCPDNAVAITPAPLPRRDIPPEDSSALETVLGKLPTTPTEADVRDALATGLPTPPVDPQTGLAGVPPQVFVQVKAADVGVALFARTGVEDKDCVLGNRVGGAVKVWSLNWRDLGPLEKPCSAEAAFAGPS